MELTPNRRWGSIGDRLRVGIGYFWGENGVTFRPPRRAMVAEFILGVVLPYLDILRWI